MKGEDMDWREENKLKQKAQEYYEKEFSYNQVYIQGYSDGYAMAIDEFADSIKTELDRFGVVNLDTCVLYDFIDRKAERLKAGGENV